MDICGYIDHEYSILNRSILEAEIEYQHECFETLKKKYDRYITEADEEEFEEDWPEEDDDYRKERLRTAIKNVKIAIKKFFENITNAMQRWIVKILSHFGKFKNKISKIFDEKKFQSPSLGVKETAETTVEVLRSFDECYGNKEYRKARAILDNFLQDIHNIIGTKNNTDYDSEMMCLFEYKNSIQTIKSFKKTIIYSNKVANSKYIHDIKSQLKIVKFIIMAIQKRTAYAAKLILKAAKIVNKQDADIPEQELKKLDYDINEFKLQLYLNTSVVPEEFGEEDD